MECQNPVKSTKLHLNFLINFSTLFSAHCEHLYPAVRQWIRNWQGVFRGGSDTADVCGFYPETASDISSKNLDGRVVNCGSILDSLCQSCCAPYRGDGYDSLI